MLSLLTPLPLTSSLYLSLHYRELVSWWVKVNQAMPLPRHWASSGGGMLFYSLVLILLHVLGCIFSLSGLYLEPRYFLEYSTGKHQCSGRSWHFLTIAVLHLFFWKLFTRITVGYHRLYSHRAFRAPFGIRLFLMVLGSMGFQGSIKVSSKIINLVLILDSLRLVVVRLVSLWVNSSGSIYRTSCGWLGVLGTGYTMWASLLPAS